MWELNFFNGLWVIIHFNNGTWVKAFEMLRERHNPNISILSPETPFIERILFWVLLLEKMSNEHWTIFL